MNTDREYPWETLSRVRVAFALVGMGWAMWWISMWVPAAYEGFMGVRKPGTSADSLGLTVFGAIAFPYSLFAPDKEVTRSNLPLYFVCFDYCFALASCTWVAIFRPHLPTVYIARLAAWGLLAAPLYFISREFGDGAFLAAGPGDVIWLVGSGLIGLAGWIAPPRVENEPWFAWSVIWRARRGRPVLRTE